MQPGALSLGRWRAAGARPQRLELAQDAIAEGVAGPRERERDVSMETLEPTGSARAPDPEFERCAAVASDPPGGKLSPDAPLIRRRLGKAGREARVKLHLLAPAHHSPGRLQSGDRSDEMWASQVVRGWERSPGFVVRRLFGDRRPAERATANNAAKRSRRTTELLLH